MRSVCIAALLAVAAVVGSAEDFEYKVGFYALSMVYNGSLGDSRLFEDFLKTTYILFIVVQRQP